MANMLDYLAWRKDVPFSVSPFNEVDGLVLSELMYSDFSGCVPEDGVRVPLSEVRRRFWEKHDRQQILADDNITKMAPFLMDDMADSPRFGGTELSWFCDVVDVKAEVQMAAVTFWLPDGTAFVAFRGTDGTIVGWKEDFLMSYLPETEGQRRAAAYLSGHFAGCDLPLRVGGHSKGGNFAVYAAVRADAAIRKRILNVYNNDGPGFLPAFTQTEAYRDMVSRIVCIVPEDCLIGSLLTSEAYQHVVKSTAGGVMQHDGFSWQVLGPRFVEVEKRSESSLLTEGILREWLYGIREEDRRLFVNTLFGLLESSGVETISQLRTEKTRALTNILLSSMDKERREAVWGPLLQLFKTGGGSVVHDARRTLKDRLEALGITVTLDKKPEEPT